eukprot:scaffold129137_cov48-Phaeocystis_antarctica.AAC.1
MATVMSMVLSVAAASELVVNVGLQQGSFLIGKDIGPLNPHDYRPNEFVTSDVREHLLKPRTHEPSSLTSRVRRSLCTRGSPLGTESTPRAWTGSPARMTTLWPPRWPPAGVRTTMLTLRHPPPPSTRSRSRSGRASRSTTERRGTRRPRRSTSTRSWAAPASLVRVRVRVS